MGVEIPYIRRRTSFRRVAAALKDTDYARKRQSSSMYDRSGNCKTSVGFGSLIDESVGDDMAGCCEYTSNTYSAGNAHVRYICRDETLNNVAGSRLASETAWGLHPGDSSADSKGKKEIMQLRNWREPSQPTIVQTQQVAPPDHVPVERVIEELIANVPAHVQQIAAEVQKKQAEVEQRLGFGTLQPFRPSHSVLQRLGLISNLDVLRATATTTQCGGSDKYFGDIAIAHSRSTNIPENQNCSLWILGLPANVTHAQLLGAIREIGKVYATVINPPTLTHHTSAAKLVFFERSQAERLMYRIQTGSFKVMGQSVVDVRWNTFKSAAYPQPDHSRSIRITGPAHLMDFDFFEIFFKSRFTYELDRRAAVRCSSPGMVAHEWHFGSLRCQAASAKTAIERELQTIFLVQWARDPCAFP
jgi:hypothetical protein